MQHRGRKLKELTLTLNEIVVRHKNSIKLQRMPIYRVEVWLGNTIVDETADIIAAYDRKN
jgi:hypothetical protein